LIYQIIDSYIISLMWMITNFLLEIKIRLRIIYYHTETLS